MRKMGVFIAIAFGVVFVVGAVLTASGRLWWESGKYSAVVLQRPNSITTVYSGGEGLLLKIGDSSRESYVVYPQRHELGAAEPNRFVHLPWCVLSLDSPATYIPIAKYEVPANSQFGERMVEFQSVRGEEIVVRW